MLCLEVRPNEVPEVLVYLVRLTVSLIAVMMLPKTATVMVVTVAPSLTNTFSRLLMAKTQCGCIVVRSE